MEEKQTEKLEFSEGIDKIVKLFKEEIEDLEEDDVKYTRAKLKEINKLYKQKYQKTKTEITKDLLNTLRDKIPEKEDVKKFLKKLGKVRVKIIIKKD